MLLNSSILRLPETDVPLMILSPKVKIDYKINISKISIIPAVAIGYSNWGFRGPAMQMTDMNGNTIQVGKYRENYNGLTLKGAQK